MLQVQRNGFARRFQTEGFRRVSGARRLHAVRQHHVHDGNDADGERADRGGVQRVAVRRVAERVLGGARVHHQMDTEHIAGFLQVLDHIRSGQVERRRDAGQGDIDVELRPGRVRAQPHVSGPHRRRQ